MLFHFLHQDGPDRRLAQLVLFLLVLHLLLEAFYLAMELLDLLLSFLSFRFLALLEGVQLVFERLDSLLVLVPPLPAIFELL